MTTTEKSQTVKDNFQVARCLKTNPNMNFQKQRTTHENEQELPIPTEGSQTSKIPTNVKKGQIIPKLQKPDTHM